MFDAVVAFHMRPIWFKYVMLCMLFAIVYFLMGQLDRNAFDRPIDVVTAIYFSIATQSTVGYGDVHPMRDYAKLIVCFHVVTSLLLILFPLSDIHAGMRDMQKGKATLQ